MINLIASRIGSLDDHTFIRHVYSTVTPIMFWLGEKCEVSGYTNKHYIHWTYYTICKIGSNFTNKQYVKLIHCVTKLIYVADIYDFRFRSESGWAKFDKSGNFQDLVFSIVWLAEPKRTENWSYKQPYFPRLA